MPVDPGPETEPVPLRPEEVGPVGERLAEYYEAARRDYGETGKMAHGIAMLGYLYALEDHVREHGEPVETETRIYRIGPDDELLDHPKTLDLCGERERREIESAAGFTGA